MNRGTRENHFPPKLFPARVCRWYPHRAVFLDRHISFVEYLQSLAHAVVKLNEKELGALTLIFFANLRVVIVFSFLVPALALHWIAKKI
jgi:hypothetical protein